MAASAQRSPARRRRPNPSDRAQPMQDLPPLSVAPRAKLRPDQAVALCALSNEYYRHGYLEKAQAILQGLVELAPQHAEAHLALAVVADELGQPKVAFHGFKRYEMLKPRCAEPDLRRAEICIDHRDLPKARALLIRAQQKAKAARDGGALNRARALASLAGLSEALR